MQQMKIKLDLLTSPSTKVKVLEAFPNTNSERAMATGVRTNMNKLD